MHRIRLGPPWEITAVEGRTWHVRRFGRPRLDPEEQVWLVIDALPENAEVFVNGTGFATAVCPFAEEITTLLKPRNELRIATAEGELIGEVALEIIRAAE